MLSSHHTPRNGDYAAHIDQLVNQGARAPGQTAATKSAKNRRWQKTVSVEKTFATSDSDDTPASLVDASKRRSLGVFRYVIAVFLLIHAARIVLGAIRYGTDIDDFVPAIFLAGVAIMILRWARTSRRQSKLTPKRLPPLTTLSN